ncbi:hypothetical protein [Priestia koreensis]|uniref:hypothetical protein n=1 Tax=Priestia koreensis TaxID=284581 RepID=UPI00203E186D|nr:hypothetical protein [Priestia koreensis]MCM3006085.1 hypothetical protein [Priestia koreensis]
MLNITSTVFAAVVIIFGLYGTITGKTTFLPMMFIALTLLMITRSIQEFLRQRKLSESLYIAVGLF